MSRVYAPGSLHCAEAREPESDGRCAIISRNAEERHETRVSSLPTRNMREQFESGSAAGIDVAASFKAGTRKTQLKPERTALMAVSED